MTVIDIVIVLLFITALMRGAERGLIRQLCSTTGLLLGFILGAFAQGKLIHLADNPGDKALVSLIVILTSVIVCTAIGEYTGAIIKTRLENLELQKINMADKGTGLVVGGATLLLIVWFMAAIFSNAPLPSLKRQIDHSVIISQLNQSLPSAPSVFSRLGHLIDPNGFPDVFTGLEPAIDTSKPLPSIGQLDTAVAVARTSTVKVQGQGCGGLSTGSGFIGDDRYVITNAHVIAGVDKPQVVDAKGRHGAVVRLFDPTLDLAVLEVDNLAGEPLTLLGGIANQYTPAAALGYPAGGDFTAEAAVILDAFKAQGRDIYNQGASVRQIYSLKTTVEPGNSGGPLVDIDGAVIGVVFAQSTINEQVGYALTMDAVIAGLNRAKDQNRVYDTGDCTH